MVSIADSTGSIQTRSRAAADDSGNQGANVLT